MKKNIVIYLLLVSMGQAVWSTDPNSSGVSQETVTERKAQPGFWTDYRKRIAYIASGMSVGIMGGLLWYSAQDIAHHVQDPLPRKIMQSVLKKDNLSAAEFTSWMSGITIFVRVLCLGIFGGAGYLLKKGVEKNDFGSKIDQVIG